MRTLHVFAIAVLAANALARQAGVHVEEAKLLGGDTNLGDALGSAVAIDGDTLILGAPTADPNERGAAYVFVRTSGAWAQQAKLVASLGTTADFDHFGAAVAIEGDSVLVGAPDWGTEDGHIHVFRRSGTTWTALQLLGPPTTGYFYRFGHDVALSGNTLAASAPYFGPQFEGAIAIYRELAGTWTFETWITTGWNAPGDYTGEDLDLSLDGSIQRVLATARNTGAVTYSDHFGSWNPRFAIHPPGPVDGVALDGTTVVFAESNATVSGMAGAGKVQVWIASAAASQSPMFQANLVASDAAAGDRFGASIGVDGNRIIVGAPFSSSPGLASRGAAYVFERVGSTWFQRAKIVASDAASGALFGSAVGVSGAATVAGAPGDNGGSGAGYAGRSGFPAVTYCSSGTSSSGCAASMSSTGMPSASLATPFALNVSNVDGQRAGLIFYGASGTETTPWGGASTLCVKSPLQRTRTQLSGGSAGACDGALVLDWNLFVTQYPTALGQPFTAGEQLWAQAWYRDPASGKTTQLSDALAFVVQP